MCYAVRQEWGRCLPLAGRKRCLLPGQGWQGVRRGPAAGVQLCKSGVRREGRTCLDKKLSEKRGERKIEPFPYGERQGFLLLSALQEVTHSSAGGMARLHPGRRALCANPGLWETEESRAICPWQWESFTCGWDRLAKELMAFIKF